MKDKHPDTAPSLLERTRAAAHSRCFCCGTEHPTGLRLEFREAGEGSVTARFRGGRSFEGYPETLHGGVVAALLDSAMTNCLFSKGIVAVTAELTVRFLRPVRLERPARVTASIARVRGPLYYLQAELTQGRTLTARAQATFMNRDRAARARHPDRASSTTRPVGGTTWPSSRRAARVP
jgi:uncharacterized protein (TIGR00369 family)